MATPCWLGEGSRCRAFARSGRSWCPIHLRLFAPARVFLMNMAMASSGGTGARLIWPVGPRSPGLAGFTYCRYWGATATFDRRNDSYWKKASALVGFSACQEGLTGTSIQL